MTRDPLDTGYMTVAETYGLLTEAPSEQALTAIEEHMRQAHMPLDFLPDRSVPIRTAKTQFLLYQSPISPCGFRASTCPLYRIRKRKAMIITTS